MWTNIHRIIAKIKRMRAVGKIIEEVLGNALFNRIYREVMKIEGGIANDPDDKGGFTNHGISLQFAITVPDEDRDGFQDTDFDRDGDVDADDLRLLNDPRTHALYIRYFFTKPRLDELPCEIQHQAFDFGVHSGPSRAILFLQRVLILENISPGRPDGIVGPKTIAACHEAINTIGHAKLNYICAESRLAFLLRIQSNDPTQAKYTGWKVRAERFMYPENIIVRA